MFAIPDFSVTGVDVGFWTAPFTLREQLPLGSLSESSREICAQIRYVPSGTDAIEPTFENAGN
jgi:hypothetical protein